MVESEEMFDGFYMATRDMGRHIICDCGRACGGIPRGTQGIFDNEYDNADFSEPLSSDNQIHICHWDKSAYIVLRQHVDERTTNYVVISMEDYIQLTENMDEINALVQQVNRGDTLAYKYVMRRGASITVDSRYAGVLLSTRDKCFAKHAHIFLPCTAWNKLISLDLHKDIPLLNVMTIASLRPSWGQY